jgi:hypothetical protein
MNNIKDFALINFNQVIVTFKDGVTKLEQIYNINFSEGIIYTSNGLYITM